MEEGSLLLGDLDFWYSTADSTSIDPLYDDTIRGITGHPRIGSREGVDTLLNRSYDLKLISSWDSAHFTYARFLGCIFTEQAIRKWNSLYPNRRIEHVPWNRYCVTLRVCKTVSNGRTVSTWGIKNPDANSPLCAERFIREHLSARWLKTGEIFKKNSPLISILDDKGGSGKWFLPRTAFESFLKLYEGKFGATGVRTHSCRKGFLTMCATTGISLGIARMLARLEIGTLEHYLTAYPDTIAHYIVVLLNWAVKSFESIKNGQPVQFIQY